ncbi:Nitroreductase [Pestalotiopsis sp. NC0098]|nr:Nitroreductase [Pestalotiopsis sp. NC0098]
MSDISKLLEARYGYASPSGSGSANPTLETLLQHRSVRNFLPQQLPSGTVEVLVAAGQSAATSSNLQTWSVVAVEDPDRKAQAALLSGDQEFIRAAPLFLVFCADLSRLTRVSERRGHLGTGLEYTEMFLMASIDAALAAQNASVAAESLGLGICYVGAIRNKPRDVADLLKLPDRVIALFGLAVGVPDPASPASVKPRLGLAEVLHRETWEDDKEKQAGQFDKYDDALASFNAGQKREGIPAWTERCAKRVATVDSLSGRHVWNDVLRERGFDLK